MKTKKLFLMAAMLLTSVCMFAQSNNNEPLKGDVNDDGKVDVADIVAIIEIMANGGGTVSDFTWYQGVATKEIQDLFNSESYFDNPNNQIEVQNYMNGLAYNQATKPANNSTLTLARGYNVFYWCPIKN